MEATYFVPFNLIPDIMNRMFVSPHLPNKSPNHCSGIIFECGGLWELSLVSVRSWRSLWVKGRPRLPVCHVRAHWGGGRQQARRELSARQWACRHCHRGLLRLRESWEINSSCFIYQSMILCHSSPSVTWDIENPVPRAASLVGWQLASRTPQLRPGAAK